MFYDLKVRIEFSENTKFIVPDVLYFSIYKNPIEKLSNIYVFTFVVDYVQAIEIIKKFNSYGPFYLTYSLFEIKKDERDLRKIVKNEISRNKLIVKNIYSGKYIGSSNERIIITALCVSELSYIFSERKLSKQTYSFENGAEGVIKEISSEFLKYETEVENPKFEFCLPKKIKRKISDFYYPVFFINEKPERYIFYGITIPSNISILESLNFVNRKYKLTYYPTLFFYDDFNFLNSSKKNIFSSDYLIGISFFPNLEKAFKKNVKDLFNLRFRRFLGNIFRNISSIKNFSNIEFYFSDESGAPIFEKETIEKNNFEFSKSIMTELPDDAELFKKRIKENIEKLSKSKFHFYEIEGVPIEYFEIGKIYKFPGDNTYSQNLISLTHNFVFTQSDFGYGYKLITDLIFQEI